MRVLTDKCKMLQRKVRHDDRDALFSQENIIEQLSREGYEGVTIRTLTYWRSQGLLPPLERYGNEYFYSKSILDSIRVLCLSSRVKNNRYSTVFPYSIDGEAFDIIRVELVKFDGVAKVILHERDGGFLVRDVEGEEWYAFTRAYENN